MTLNFTEEEYQDSLVAKELERALTNLRRADELSSGNVFAQPLIEEAMVGVSRVLRLLKSTPGGEITITEKADAA